MFEFINKRNFVECFFVFDNFVCFRFSIFVIGKIRLFFYFFRFIVRERCLF